MDGALGGFGPHLAVLLITGLGASLALGYAARMPRGEAVLARLGGWALSASCVGALAVCGAVAYLILRAVVDSAANGPAAISVWHAFGLGLAVGVPIGLPGVIATYFEARRRARHRAKRRDFVPTKDDRRAYADRLLRQILDVSPEPRELTASITGNGGTVLSFEGDIDAKEGERLTAALREDLKDVGFKRVEGKKGSKTWWSRV